MAWRRTIFASSLHIAVAVCAGVMICLASAAFAQETSPPEPPAGERLPAPEAAPELLAAPAPAGETDIAIEPDEGPVLSPDQPGNVREEAGAGFEEGPGAAEGPVLDPNQVGNVRRRLSEIEGRITEYPLIRLSGFFQLDDGLYSQTAASRGRYGDIQDGVGFRRVRLQALGELTEFTAYTIEVDFAQAGRPSLLDVWGEIDEIPWFGTIRIGQFRQPGLMDSWTSVRHLDFLERSAAFQAVASPCSTGPCGGPK